MKNAAEYELAVATAPVANAPTPVPSVQGILSALGKQ